MTVRLLEINKYTESLNSALLDLLLNEILKYEQLN
jgi:hypothetical protein